MIESVTRFSKIAMQLVFIFTAKVVLSLRKCESEIMLMRGLYGGEVWREIKIPKTVDIIVLFMVK